MYTTNTCHTHARGATTHTHKYHSLKKSRLASVLAEWTGEEERIVTGGKRQKGTWYDSPVRRSLLRRSTTSGADDMMDRRET